MSRALALLAVALIAGPLTGAEPTPAADVVFAGVLVSGGQTSVHLTAADAARWIEVGRNFGAYRVENYDAAAATVTLTKPGATLRLPLKDPGKVQSCDSSGTTGVNADARRALWEKVKDLDGLELAREFGANAGGNRDYAALAYLDQQCARLQSEAAAHKLAWEALMNQANPSEETQRGLRPSTICWICRSATLHTCVWISSCREPN